MFIMKLKGLELWSLQVVCQLLGVLGLEGNPTDHIPFQSIPNYFFPSKIIAGNFTFMMHTQRVSPNVILKGQCEEQEVNFCNFSDVSTLKNTSLSILPPEYEMINGLGFYKLHPEPLTWDEARETCIREKAHLMIINSDEEGNVLKYLYAREKKKFLTVGLHIGIHDKHQEGQFVTVLGNPLNYTLWRPGQPDGGMDQNCGFTYSDGKLCDGECSWKMGFICEIKLETEVEDTNNM